MCINFYSFTRNISRSLRDRSFLFVELLKLFVFMENERDIHYDILFY